MAASTALNAVRPLAALIGLLFELSLTLLTLLVIGLMLGGFVGFAAGALAVQVFIPTASTTIRVVVICVIGIIGWANGVIFALRQD